MVPGNPKILCDVIKCTPSERAYIYRWWERRLEPWWVRLVTLPAWLVYEALMRREIERERRSKA